MKVWLLVYGALYVAFEVVGYQLERIGWADISGLDVATALTDAFLTVALCAAALLALDLGSERSRRWMTARRLDRTGEQYELWDEPLTWRPAPLSVSAERVDEPARTPYTGNPYSFAGHRFPKDSGTLL